MSDNPHRKKIADAVFALDGILQEALADTYEIEASKLRGTGVDRKVSYSHRRLETARQRVSEFYRELTV